MTVLKGITPTPAQVADAYKQAFSPAIDQAAGKDGRISRREAERMAGRDDAGKLVADNLANFFEATGQKSVSANKFKGVVAAYAERHAERQAGPNQRLSLLELRMRVLYSAMICAERLGKISARKNLRNKCKVNVTTYRYVIYKSRQAR